MTGEPWDGFIPGATCKRCGVRLQGRGEGRPAESYAGTYNGLCYPCTSRPGEVIGVFSDGAVLIEYPPHLPSWRRDRETFFAFQDCPACHGHGRTWEHSSGPFGGSFPAQCRACTDRRYGAFWRYKNRMQEIRNEVAEIEKAASKLKIPASDDEAWKVHELANRYRALVREAWETPIVREPHPTLTRTHAEN